MSYCPIIQFRAALALAMVTIAVAGCNDTEVSPPKPIVESISRGGDMDVPRGRTTWLKLAVESNDVPLVESLLHHGADVDVRDIEGHGGVWDVTPLHTATLNGFIDVAKVLIRHGANVDAVYSSGRTPLHVAASEGNIKMVQLLLDAGADSDIRAQYGTALHRAAARGRVRVAKVLIRHGINVNVLDSFGSTPLHVAAARGHFETVQLLLNAGVDPKIRSKQWGKTARQIAVERKQVGRNIEVIELLSKYHLATP